MKKFLAGLFVTVAIAGVFFVLGENSLFRNSDARQETVRKDQQTQRSQHKDQLEWQTFVRESELIIETNIQKIAALKEKLEEAGPKEMKQFGKRADVLEEKNQQLKGVLEDYKSERQMEWLEFRTNFKQDIDGLEKKIQNILKESG